jgi:hypothetical protein
MPRRYHGYLLATVAWSVVAIGGTFLAYFGPGESYIDPALLPGRGWRPVAAVPEGPYVLGTAVVLMGGGVLAIRFLRGLSWRWTGRRVGLSTAGVVNPDLAGSVDGRPVRVRRIARVKHTKSSGSGKHPYTVVEAKLDESVDAGVMVDRTEGDAGLLARLLGDGGGADELELSAGGGDYGETLTRRARNALLGVTYFGRLSVGTAPDRRIDEMTAMRQSVAESVADRTFTPSVPGDVHDDPSWVTHETSGVMLEPRELRRQVEAVAAVAAAFDGATTRDASAATARN